MAERSDSEWPDGEPLFDGDVLMYDPTGELYCDPSDELELDEEQIAELLRRMEQARANPGVGVSWPEIKARLLGAG